MGIVKFYGDWIKKRLPSCLQNRLPENISSLSIDMNGLLHEIARKIFAYGENIDPRRLKYVKNTSYATLESDFHKALANEIMLIVTGVNPRDTLILAVDGVAPAAKIQQQRQRRFQKKMDSKLKFDSNAISPGTTFMKNLDNFIENIFIPENQNLLPTKVIYSSHLDHGEAEHKIMKYYKMSIHNENIFSVKNGSHVLYGLDADLIMLSIISPLPNIFLARQDLRQIINIEVIKKYLLEFSENENVLKDFIIITTLIGDDFVPQSPSVSTVGPTMEVLMDIYAKGKYKISKNEDIDIVELLRYIGDVAVYEEKFIIGKYGPTKKIKHIVEKAVENRIFYFDKFRNYWYHNALGMRGPKLLINDMNNMKGIIMPKVKTENVVTMCIDYVRIIHWIFRYYNMGYEYVNVDLFYPYHHAPLLSDVSSLDVESLEIDGYKEHGEMIRFNALEQLVSILPTSSINLLPPFAKFLFEYDSPIYDLFPYEFITERSPDDPPHVATHIIPFIDKKRIKMVFEASSIPKGKYKNYMQKDFMICEKELIPQIIKSRRTSIPLNKPKRAYSKYKETDPLINDVIVEKRVSTIKSNKITEKLGESEVDDKQDNVFEQLRRQNENVKVIKGGMNQNKKQNVDKFNVNINSFLIEGENPFGKNV